MKDGAKTSGKHILLADDQQEVRDTIKLLLRLDQHTIVEAANGREALGLYTREPYDLVITDYAMPEMRGDELAATIKELDPSQPILMLTGSAEFLTQGVMRVDALLMKPFALEDLREAITRLCSRKMVRAAGLEPAAPSV